MCLRYHAEPIVVEGNTVKTVVDVTGFKGAVFRHECDYVFAADGSVSVVNKVVPYDASNSRYVDENQGSAPIGRTGAGFLRRFLLQYPSMRPIATDTHDFPSLRRDGCIYVDKTKFIHRLVFTVGSMLSLDSERICEWRHHQRSHQGRSDAEQLPSPNAGHVRKALHRWPEHRLLPHQFCGGRWVPVLHRLRV